MLEKEILFLTIPFLALLVGFVFTYIHVWHNKSKREALESQITEDILAKLREQKTERIQKNTENKKVLDESVKEALAQSLATENRLKKSYEENKRLLELLSKQEAQANASQLRRSWGGYVGIGNPLGGTFIGETKAAMQELSRQTNPAAKGYLGELYSGKLGIISVKGSSSKTK